MQVRSVKKITVQGVYPQWILIKRWSSDSPHKIIPHSPCPDSTCIDQNQKSDSEEGNCDRGLQTSKENYGKETYVKLMDVCSYVVNNKEIKLYIKFSDICVTEPDCEETDLPDPCQVPPVIPVNFHGKS